MTKLCELAIKWACDKTPQIRHGYTPYYHQLLQNRPIQRLLEIGVGGGASLHMWQEYFPQAAIFGLDIQPRFIFNEGHIQTRLCDAANSSELKAAADEFGGNFDLIIDDGSHFPDHQILAFETLFSFLAPAGIYVIEDIPDPDAVSARIQPAHEVHRFDSVPPPLLDDNLIVIFDTREQS